MSETVLSIGQSLSDDVGLPRYNNLFGNMEQNARRILNSIKDGLLLDVFSDADWEMLKVSSTISVLGSGVTTYDLPSDFDRIINDTIWDSTNSRPVRGPVDLREWQVYVSGASQIAGLDLVCRIQGDQDNNEKVMTFYPDTSASTVLFWYISKKCVYSSANETKETITADDDLFIVPDKAVRAAAKWRLLRSIGMDFKDELMEYKSLVDDLMANDTGGKKIHTNRMMKFDIANVPQTGFGS
jgi:hypothetical protein